ncbi:class I SAM-dependent methyltransferase [Paenarthrobacter sp. JL.01a]|uniref:class I SAM-dependent methyltransferase n=1 Tax=Paenarthrobacter sp. JL.01a TaxID=2979324 RepID=UPI0021CA5A40|nr:class I SAM-dependent methyltransferase [Paenarthrobacter sp. JL.01a]UXM91961.1 class I SAM-dependent methyltransferase [Paenarthrobacter sp. JL.01a]
MRSHTVRAAYAARAAEYTRLFGSISSMHPSDRALVREWAGELDGKVIDAGCGPGQWASFLHSLGTDVEGVDLVPEFIATARENYPDIHFSLGSLEQLSTPYGSLAGILAWYSVIHTPPEDLGAVFTEFARRLRPGGSLLLGFFEADAVEEIPARRNARLLLACGGDVRPVGACRFRPGQRGLADGSRSPPPCGGRGSTSVRLSGGPDALQRFSNFDGFSTKITE